MIDETKLFDTNTQLIKYKVLREVARLRWKDAPDSELLNVPEIVSPGKKATLRCCVYKERAVAAKRIRIAMGLYHRQSKDFAHVIRSIDIACDECPSGGYRVTEVCRGCLAHPCVGACKRGAITYELGHGSRIDKSKCVECGACAKVCPFGAIVAQKRPCQNACKVKAVTIDEENVSRIDYAKCTGCGACSYQCPFGAITDKTYILDVIDMLKERADGGTKKLYAVVAPAIASQFSYAKIGQIVTAIRQLGFDGVFEAALGADMVAQEEGKELAKDGFLISSCCPAFVRFVRNNFPKLAPHISTCLSPMARISKYIKEHEGDCQIVFIGPCTAKKEEMQLETVSPYVDSVITFEELQALIDSRDLDVPAMEETPLDGASYFGRIFAHCGGLATAVKEVLKEENIDFDLKPISCDGLDACRNALLKYQAGVLDVNFIEGMACEGGCVGGSGCLTHNAQSAKLVDKYAKEGDATVSESVLHHIEEE